MERIDWEIDKKIKILEKVHSFNDSKSETKTESLTGVLKMLSRKEGNK